VEQAEAIGKQAGVAVADELKDLDSLVTELRGVRARLHAQYAATQANAEKAMTTEMMQLSVSATVQIHISIHLLM